MTQNGSIRINLSVYYIHSYFEDLYWYDISSVLKLYQWRYIPEANL